MRAILLLVIQNIKKKKINYISIAAMIFISTLLLNIGIMTFLEFSKFFAEKVEQLNAPDAVIAMSNNDYKDSIEEYMNDYDGVTSTEKEDIIYQQSASFKLGNSDYASPMMIKNLNSDRNMSIIYIQGETREYGDQTVYLPYLLKTNGGYDLGDEFVLTMKGKDYSFRVAGFTEDIYMGSINLGGIGFHVNDLTFSRLIDELGPDSCGVMVSAKMNNHSYSQRFISDCQKEVVETDNLWTCYYDLAQVARSTTANIIAVLIVAFSLIIVLISCIVINFRIRNNIQTEIKDIGALKAIGYKASQIKLDYVLQYLFSALMGGLIGTLISYFIMPTIKSIISGQTGLMWKGNPSIIYGMVSFIALLILVFTEVWICLRRIRNINSVDALNGNIIINKKFRNFITIEKGHLNNIYLIGIKNIFCTMRQSISIGLIILGLSFACCFSIVLYYNVAVDSNSFIKLISSELCSVQVTMIGDVNEDTTIQELRQKDGVKKAEFFDTVTTVVEGEKVFAYVSEDFSTLENNYVYKGEFPDTKDEVAIGGGMAKKFNLDIDDYISITFDKNTKRYKIVGLSQTANNMGMDMSLTYDGLAEMSSDYQKHSIYIYLDDSVVADEFIDQLDEEYDEGKLVYTNIDANIDTMAANYITIITLLAYVIIVITSLMIIIILNLVIGNAINERRYDLGVQKAVGFTTFQLMRQMTVSYLPIIIMGSLLGAILSFYASNPLLSGILQSLGIMKAQFYIDFRMIVFVTIGISALAYLISMFVTYRIRKVYAYEMISE